MNEKSTKIRLLEEILRFMARAILAKYHPRIIGITGSIGKTSAKEAVFTVLEGKFNVRRNEKNYNNEIGLPLTILGVESGESSLVKWMLIFLKWIGLMVWPAKYPEILVLEMGADRPGDIGYLTDFIKSDIGIITDISGSHLEFFGSVEGVAKEKGILVKRLNKSQLAVLNGDNPQVLKLRNQIEARTLTFGFKEGADVRSADVTFSYEDKEELKGLSFKLNYRGTTIPVRLKNILAPYQIYAALAGACVGVEMEMNLVEIAEALENFASPPGRMTLVSGIRGTQIIDDTYNASPSSTRAALEVLGEIKAMRKIAVLGDMLEIGKDSEKEHRRLASELLKVKTDVVVAVGSRMKFLAEELIKKGFNSENLMVYSNSLEASKKLKRSLKAGDLILVKGSHGVRMEKVVEEVMAEPEKAKEILCRQSEHWKITPVKSI